MRLDKYLSGSGKGSRKDIKQLLKSGIVSVNDKCIKDPAYKVNETADLVKIGEEEIIYREFIYLMLNKPAGYVSAVFDKKLPVVTDLVPPEYAHFEVFPVGRLDIDTEGLLILTNDGALTHRVLSPRSHVNKTYYAKCALPIKKEDPEAFRDGVVLDDGYKTMPALLEVGDSPSECFITIKEGKFHQVKRMMEAVGNKVEYLKRIRMGSLNLDPGLEKGKIRELTQEEIIMMEEKE